MPANNIKTARRCQYVFAYTVERRVPYIPVRCTHAAGSTWAAIILAHAGTLSVYAPVSDPVQLQRRRGERYDKQREARKRSGQAPWG